MSDPNKYINYYVENSMSMVHEYINTLLQTKTQLRVLEDQVKDKDAIIASLQDELNRRTTNEQELNQVKANATTWENSYNDMRNKVSHMDTLTGQIAEAKKMLMEKNSEVSVLKKELENLKTQVSEKDGQIKELKKLVPSNLLPKKVINTKKKSTSVSEEEPKIEANTTPVVEVKAKPPIVPYKPGVVGEKVPYSPTKANNEVALKVVDVVESENETDDF